MFHMGRIAAGVAIGLIALVGLIFVYGWFGSGPLDEEKTFIVTGGSTLTSVAGQLEKEGAISSADRFLLRSKILGSSDPVKAGEFKLPAGASEREILSLFQFGNVVLRQVTIPEGTPSIIVREKLMAEDLLTGEVEFPAEGSVLPDTYSFERGESRAAVLKRMQDAMVEAIAELWPERTTRTVVSTPRDAVILASIVEKETGKAEERRMVAGLYSNRLKKPMMLQADPTIIYPITKGKPLGRRIRQSEIAAINDYNTYSKMGLPKGPITNPGRESIAAVLNPAETSALFMVADGTGGHKFADTLEEHNQNVERWFAIRRERGEM